MVILTLFRKPIPIEEALIKLMQFPKQIEEEYIELTESAGRILSRDVYAPHPVPWFIRSPYDGYAVRANSTEEAGENNPIWLELLGTVAAGDVWHGTVQEGQAVKIMTGGAVPDGANAVIMRELTKEEERDGKTFVQLKRKLKEGENISSVGEDIEEGKQLLTKGTYINAGVIALLATFGYEKVPVTRKPKVAIIATGSELLSTDEPLMPGKIRNSNGFMLHTQALRSGAEPISFGVVKDTFEQTLETVQAALKEADIVVTTGGVSVGDFDYIPAVYKELGAELLFNKIAMRPGSVTSAAVLGDQLLFGLSGNPSACYVGFELFTRPVIRTMLGMENVYLQKVEATLKQDVLKANPFTRFVRSKLSFEGGRLYVQPSGKDKSNIISSLPGADCFMVLPGGTRGWQTGSMVEVVLIEGQDGMKEWK